MTRSVSLPSVLGLLGGVPIVWRELETRTAQTAWSLSPSRLRQLAHQISSIGLVLGVVMVFAAVVATRSGRSGCAGAGVAGRT
jgi:hypothetical protein